MHLFTLFQHKQNSTLQNPAKNGSGGFLPSPAHRSWSLEMQPTVFEDTSLSNYIENHTMMQNLPWPIILLESSPSMSQMSTVWTYHSLSILLNQAGFVDVSHFLGGGICTHNTLRIFFYEIQMVNFHTIIEVIQL